MKDAVAGLYVIVREVSGRHEVFKRYGTNPEWSTLRKLSPKDKGLRMTVVLFTAKEDANARLKQLRSHNVPGKLSIVTYVEAYETLLRESTAAPIDIGGK